MSARGTPADELVRGLLARVEAGDQEARSELLALFYEDLRARAHEILRGWKRGSTLQTTALANEACLRLLGNSAPFCDREHFLAAAARAMRSFLVDRVRARRRLKRTPEGDRVPLDGLLDAYEDSGIDVAQLDAAIGKLAAFDPLMARAVELRFFAALDVGETARILGLSRRTFDRRWRATRAWLRASLEA